MQALDGAVRLRSGAERTRYDSADGGENANDHERGCAYIRRHQLYRGHSDDRALRLDIAFRFNIVARLRFRKGARDD
jgi:hypothetical protein